MTTAAVLLAESQSPLAGSLICGGIAALVMFWLWYTSKQALEKKQREAAEYQAQQQAWAAQVQSAWAAQQARIAAEESAKRELRAAHDRSVAELMARIAQGARLAAPGLVAMLPMKKNEEAFYATYAKAKTARGDDEPGHLIVTNQRVHWNYANPSRSDVLKTWRGIATWRHEGAERLIIEWGSGLPLVLEFNVPQGGPEHDARVACELMNRARSTEK